mgnify:CR=1 FL=1
MYFKTIRHLKMTEVNRAGTILRMNLTNNTDTDNDYRASYVFSVIVEEVIYNAKNIFTAIDSFSMYERKK